MLKAEIEECEVDDSEDDASTKKMEAQNSKLNKNLAVNKKHKQTKHEPFRRSWSS